MLVAMVILNMCGKLVDIDRSYCGAVGVLRMMRASTSPFLQTRNMTNFSRYVGDVERRILTVLGSHILHSKIATEILSQLTQWNILNESDWLRACLIFDIFYISSSSVMFTQTEIAEAIYDIVNCTTQSNSRAHENMLTCMKHFADTKPHSEDPDGMEILSDPYCGIRARHSENPNLQSIYDARL